MNREQFLNRFTFSPTKAYDSKSLERILPVKPDSLRPAAVLIALVDRGDSLHVLLTKRAAHLKHHPGQVSFPGGKYEPSDASLSYTAVREACEEVGLKETEIKVVGELPALPTISKFAVTPFIAFVDPNYSIELDENEVAEVFEVPASFLFSRENIFESQFELKHSKHKIFAIPYQKHFIWGVTAQIIDAMGRQLA